MPQKKISELTELDYESISRSGNDEQVEISGYDSNKNRASFHTTLKDIGQAIFSKFTFDDDNKTIEEKIEIAQAKNEFTEILFTDENGIKWKLWADSFLGVMCENQDVANWRQLTSKYMAFMNVPSAQDPKHNYMTLYNAAVEQEFDETKRDNMKIKGDSLVEIHAANNPEDRDNWNTIQPEFDTLYREIRNKLDPPTGEAEYYYDPEFSQQNSLLSRLQTKLETNTQYVTNHTVILIPDPEDPTQNIDIKQDFLNYLNSFLLSTILTPANNAKKDYTTNYTQSKFEVLEEKSKIAKSYLDDDNDLDYFMSFLTGQINDLDNMSDFASYNTYKLYVLSNPIAVDPSKQDQLDGIVENLNNLIDNIVSDIQLYFGFTKAGEGTSEEALRYRNEINRNIRTAKDYYISAKEISDPS